eukprot:364547-Chlamydomonas_euryale.AAC.3
MPIAGQTPAVADSSGQPTAGPTWAVADFSSMPTAGPTRALASCSRAPTAPPRQAAAVCQPPASRALHKMLLLLRVSAIISQVDNLTRAAAINA